MPVMDARELAQTVCQIFGHQWEPTRYRASRNSLTKGLMIYKTRVCKRRREIQSADTTT
jgi:hypothetical protein